MKRTVIYAKEAGEQISALYRQLAAGASTATATRIVTDIATRCERFGEFPFLGRSRPDLRTGVRTFTFDRKIVVAYAVEPDKVVIVGIYRRGEDFEASLRNPET